MECNVVKDLIPLYIDDCCSEESAAIVREHLSSCESCYELYESMSAPSQMTSAVSASAKLSRINNWQASILQSVLLFVSFAVITVGVALEASTSGFLEGYWAVSLVVPATGFLLSLANWYFIRLYKSRKSFSKCSLFATLGVTLCGYIWAGFYYGFNLWKLLQGINFVDFFEMLIVLIYFHGIGIILTVVCCVLSKVLSNKYAKMLGKE